jgi:nucleoside-diphosphate-sugar epimerase
VAHATEDAETNVLGTINVLDGAASHGARRVVSSSTGGGLYGEADVLPELGRQLGFRDCGPLSLVSSLARE